MGKRIIDGTATNHYLAHFVVKIAGKEVYANMSPKKNNISYLVLLTLEIFI